jgi:hypothetical protein
VIPARLPSAEHIPLRAAAPAQRPRCVQLPYQQPRFATRASAPLSAQASPDADAGRRNSTKIRRLLAADFLPDPHTMRAREAEHTCFGLPSSHIAYPRSRCKPLWLPKRRRLRVIKGFGGYAAGAGGKGRAGALRQPSLLETRCPRVAPADPVPHVRDVRSRSHENTQRPTPVPWTTTQVRRVRPPTPRTSRMAGGGDARPRPWRFERVTSHQTPKLGYREQAQTAAARRDDSTMELARGSHPGVASPGRTEPTGKGEPKPDGRGLPTPAEGIKYDPVGGGPGRGGQFSPACI